MKTEKDQDYIKLGLTGAAVVAVGLVCFFLLRELPFFCGIAKNILTILTPFVYGAVFAYLLTPGCNTLERWINRLLERAGKKNERAAAAISIPLCFLIAFLAVSALVMMVVPQVCQSIFDLAQALPGQIADVGRRVSELLENQPELQEYFETLVGQLQSRLQGWMQKDLLPMAQNILNGLSGQMAGLLTVIKNMFFGILVSMYLLASRKKFAAQSRMLLYGCLPQKAADWVLYEVKYADKMFSGFLMGKLLDSAIIGLICFAGTSLMGIRSAVLVSTIVGVTNVIPFFGPYLGAIPCILLLIFENPLHCVYFTVFIIILQQIDGNVIGPAILGNSTGLSGFWVLFSILLFGGLWGIVGMIVGVPLFAVLYDIVRRGVIRGLAHRGKLQLLADYNAMFEKEEKQKKERRTGKKQKYQNRLKGRK